jgi:hypothetical protein
MRMATVVLIYLLSRPAVYWLKFLNLFARPLAEEFKALW